MLHYDEYKMSADEIIKKILSFRKDLTRDEIHELINRKIRESRGFLTVESAARAVAAELGLEISGFSLAKGTAIRNIISGLNDVTTAGRVLHVNPIRIYMKSSGESGKMRSLYIADETGILRVIVWGEKADMLEPSEILGKIIKISHGYVREGYDGNVELNVGLRGEIEVSPPDISEDDFPSLHKFLRRINQIGDSEVRVNILGVVTEIFPVNTFTREDNTSGKVRRIRVDDGTGKIIVVLWNNKVDELSDLKVGDHIEIFRAKVRRDLNGNLEIHIDGSVEAAILSNLPSELRGGEASGNMAFRKR